MKPSLAWGVLLASVVAVASVASCSASAERMFTGTTSGAGGSVSSASSGGTGSVQNTGGGISFNDGGPSGSSSTSSSGTLPTTCDASCSAAGGTCQHGTCLLQDNPGNVSAGTQGSLKAGGTADPQFKFLYPYDQTVFPRGLIPPTLQFGGVAPTAVFVHVTYPGMDYEGWYGASSPGRLTFSAPVWKAITLQALAGVQVKVEVTKISGAQVTGPITETWSIAQGSLRGTIYYETYGSTIIPGGALSVGIMKIQPGAAVPTIFQQGCGNVCHTASADGSTLVANSGNLFDYLVSSSYDLTDGGAVLFPAANEQFTYGGIYPDGSISMSATNYRTWFGGVSALYDTRTGAQVAAPGWDGVIKNAGTVAFSPDGKKIAFNHEDTGSGHTLAVMDYESSNHTFSGLKDVANDPGSTLAWPAFTPDAKWIVYHAGSNEAFETDSGATGDVYFTSATGSAATRLDALDGYTSSGGTYLPANDPKLSFAPTVLPEAVGGYFWVVFTSHRSYGNTLPTQDNMDQNGKLWVAAFDINATPGKDASHPAFYLDGQESTADNLRGFWVLDPCQQTSSVCTSGDQCCSGFCRSEDGGPTTCVQQPSGCSNEFEKCNTGADCCDPSYQCINGHCAQPAVQ
jgi:hypothetical protein